MKGIQRALSREETQNNDNEGLEMIDIDLGSKETRGKHIHTEVYKYEAQNDIEKGFVDKYLIKNRNKLEIRKKRPKLWRCVKNAGKTILALAVVGLVSLHLLEYLKKGELIETDTDEGEFTTNLPTQVVAFQRQKPEEAGIRPYPEEYKVDMEKLYQQKELRWIPDIGNDQILSKPSSDPGCIALSSRGKYKVFNSVTLSYEDQLSMFHAVARKKANTAGLSKGLIDSVVQKANFQWKTPQTGRQPSTLLFLVDIEVGDQLCVQTNSKIYASFFDNIFLVEKL